MRVVGDDSTAHIVSASTNPENEYVGKDIADLTGGKETGVVVSGKPQDLFSANPQVAIDFTTADASMHHARLAANNKTPLMLGTTGHSQSQRDEIAGLAKTIPIAHCANTSVGVNLLLNLVEETARQLAASEWDIEIIELHHKHKRDAPSGTALSLGQAAAKGRDWVFEQVKLEERAGVRPDKGIGIAAVRGGGVAGEHSVFFLSESEQLELTHRASNRAIFARGAVIAAKWVAHAKPGLYTMQHVLGLESHSD